MRGEWRDPDDMTPDARRTGRTVTGWRSYCPLRRCIERHGASTVLTAEHVMAADHLRLLHDGARLGFSAACDLSMPVQSVFYRPSMGPSVRAMKQTQCQREFTRAWRLFDDEQHDLLGHVVLSNLPVRSWALPRHIAPTRAMAKLAGVLDLLCDFFHDELRRAPMAA
jgi:hypothetical protein